MTQLESLVARTKGLQPWRRIFHAANGVALAAALVFLDPSWGTATLVLGVVAAVLFLFDLLRFRRPGLNRLFFRWFHALASPREAEGVASSTWFMTGAFLAVAIFPREVAVPAILVLALSDPAASWVGRRWGRRRFGAGTFLGSLTFLAVATLTLLLFVSPPAALAVALVVTLTESIPWPLDDNLVIPLVTGSVLWSLLPFWA